MIHTRHRTAKAKAINAERIARFEQERADQLGAAQVASAPSQPVVEQKPQQQQPPKQQQQNRR